MERLKKRDLTKIIEYIFESFRGPKVELTKYITQVIPACVVLLEGRYNEDDLLVQLCDEKWFNIFLNRCTEILAYLNEKHQAKVAITSEFGEYFIELTEFGLRIDSGFRNLLLDNLKKFELLDDRGSVNNFV